MCWRPFASGQEYDERVLRTKALKPLKQHFTTIYSRPAPSTAVLRAAYEERFAQNRDGVDETLAWKKWEHDCKGSLHPGQILANRDIPIPNTTSASRFRMPTIIDEATKLMYESRKDLEWPRDDPAFAKATRVIIKEKFD